MSNSVIVYGFIGFVTFNIAAWVNIRVCM